MQRLKIISTTIKMLKAMFPNIMVGFKGKPPGSIMTGGKEFIYLKAKTDEGRKIIGTHGDRYSVLVGLIFEGVPKILIASEKTTFKVIKHLYIHDTRWIRIKYDDNFDWIKHE